MKLSDIAILKDKYDNEYNNEAMLLALLLKTKGSERGSKEEEDIRQYLNDPNLD